MTIKFNSIHNCFTHTHSQHHPDSHYTHNYIHIPLVIYYIYIIHKKKIYVIFKPKKLKYRRLDHFIVSYAAVSAFHLTLFLHQFILKILKKKKHPTFFSVIIIIITIIIVVISLVIMIVVKVLCHISTILLYPNDSKNPRVIGIKYKIILSMERHQIPATTTTTSTLLNK